ncbi:MAG: hypothetical protein ABSC95_24390 [Acetobacteraceae bacterium]|jgi:hypothetical protein
MTHLPFIAGSYALGILIPAGFALAAFLRLGTARRRLAAIDPRIKGPGAGPRVRSGASPRAGAGAGSHAQREATP